MNQFAYQARQPRQYTITDARQDIEYIGKRFDSWETERISLQDEVDQLRRDEWRALELCKMMKRRMDMLEMLLLHAFGAEGQRFMTHQVLTDLRTPKQMGAV